MKTGSCVKLLMIGDAGLVVSEKAGISSKTINGVRHRTCRPREGGDL